jgi:hypothetical protein
MIENHGAQGDGELDKGSDALQRLTHTSMPEHFREQHDPMIPLSTEQNSRIAIAHAINTAISSQSLQEYPLFEQVQEIHLQLLARFEGSDAALDQRLDFDQFTDALEERMDLSDSLLITAFERALNVPLSHL